MLEREINMKKVKKDPLKNEEYINIVHDILNNGEFEKRKDYRHR